MPGDWREVKGGWQWVPGFWNAAAQQQGGPAELEYLPPPPADTLEVGPSVVSPSADCFYTPGSWVYGGTKYRWRPGFWVEHRRDWVWVPDHYRWTPCGYVFIGGYWDRPLATRGVLFAPVYFRPAVFERRRYVYTPVYAVPDTSLQTCLFVRGGSSAYYFGDYYEQRYATAGYSSWCGVAVRGSNFAVGVAYSRPTYDPLWSYYAVEYRSTPAWQANITTVYAGRYKGDVPRPPTTLVQQNIVQQNVVNVTNNVTNVTNVTNVKNVAPQTMLAPVATLSQHSSQPVTLTRVSQEGRVAEQSHAKEARQVGVERRKAETAIVDKGLAVTKDDKPRAVKLDVPKTVALRAQVPTEAEKAPPPAAIAAKKPDPLKPVPTTPVAKAPPPPVIDPKTGAVTPHKKADSPHVEPTPVDPKKPTVTTAPKVDPPKVDPPKTDPTKVPPTAPPKTDPPKVDPPKGDPVKVPPVGVPPATPPKTDPPKLPPAVPPTPPSKTDPPQLPPPLAPKVDPRQDGPAEAPAVAGGAAHRIPAGAARHHTAGRAAQAAAGTAAEG